MPDGLPFSSENQPDHGKRAEAQRAMRSVKHALLNAFDTLGNEAFFVALGKGSGEDKRCLANIIAKLLPIEVAGAIDTNLTVKIVTQMGEQQIEVKRPNNLLLHAASRAPILECGPQARAVEDPAPGERDG